jgi:hypothetical protein
MKIQQYRKIEFKEHDKCEATHMNVLGERYPLCSYRASYIMGEKKLCKKHAMKEALELILEGSHEYENPTIQEKDV